MAEPETKAQGNEDSQTGLLHHEHPPLETAAPGQRGEADPADDYHPDTHHADKNPTLEQIEVAASESHHGLIRERGPRIGREEEAKLALEHTLITPATAWTLVVFFLLTIFSVPILQHVVEIRRNLAERRAAAAEGQKAEGKVLPDIYDAFQELPSWDQVRSVSTPQEAWSLIPSAARFNEHETALQDNSVIVQWTLPRAQTVLARIGVGNEQAYLGRDGWLMYRPDVDYLTSRGFLDPALMTVRQRAGDTDTAAVQPDPVRAIVDFKEQLGARGITLIVMPAPTKSMIHPEKMSSRYTTGHGLLQNPSFPQFRQAMEGAGVKLFDVAPRLVAEKHRTDQAQYLETDTHWTPSAMELAARELANFIRSEVKLPQQESPGYTRSEQEIANLGDVAEMLKLPANQTLFKKQRVRIHPVKTPDGELWYPDRDADILLLGDSFSNIFSLGGMNWGEAAGFAEQLSYEMQRPLDTIINNAGGSHVTRQQLVRDLARGKDRLKGKKLVIWEFAMRDLLSGDWKLLKLPSGKRKQTFVE